MRNDPVNWPPILGDPDRFPIHEFANPRSTQLSAKSGTFHAAERQSWIGGDHRIDENHPRLKLGCEQLLFGPIVRPGARTETEGSGICDLHGVGDIAYPEKRCDWAENFFAVSRRVDRHIDKDCRLIKKPRTMNPISARQ